MQRATRLGFPTINIHLDDTELSGIFAGRVTCGTKTFEAALYADQERKIFEAYLLDFKGILEEDIVTIQPLKKIREKKTFDDFEMLQNAISKDIDEIREFFIQS